MLTDKSGPIRQRSLYEWGLGGNTNLPANPPESATPSPTPAAIKRQRDQCVIPDEDPDRPISEGDGEEDGYFDLMGDGEGDEDDGGEDEDNLDADVDADGSSTKRVPRPLPPSIKTAYEKHLAYLKRTSGSQSKPRLYEIDQTFWLPHKANYFILHGNAKPTPEMLYNHRWFYWDPDYLVDGGLRCPNCSTHLYRHGFTRPRRVVDLENVFYIIGQRHRCPQCRHPQTNQHSVTFNSWDPRIIKMLPSSLAAEFPATLSHRNAIATPVLATMRTCFQYGMGSKQFSNCLHVLHYRRFDTIHAQYLHGILSRKSDPNPSVSYQPFGVFSDSLGYSGFVPSSKWLRGMYDKLIEDHGMEIDQKTAMCSGEICAIDHSHKVVALRYLFLEGIHFYCSR